MFTIDDYPFPRGEPDAQKLIRIMAGLYGDQRSATRLTARFGMDDQRIPPNLPPFDLWDYLLFELAKTDKVRECVQAARDAYSTNSDVPFLDTLLSVPRKRLDVPGKFDPWEYLGLFDRTTETDLLVEMLSPYAAPPPLSPIVIGILAERADEHDYFIRQVSSALLARFLGTACANQQSEPLDWADPRISAEREIRKLAKKKVGNNSDNDNIDNVIARLGPALAGRTTTLVLSNRQFPDVSEKLTHFLALWGKFGPNAPPSVLYVIVVRYDDADPSLERTEADLTSVFDKAGGGLTVIKPVTLSMCEIGNFDIWQYVLTELGRKINPLKYDQLKRLFKATFRLAELKERLELPENRIYF